jgi:predicted tellurium resistance membrane protein TerC
LNVGLGLILVFVGTKMAAADLYELPVWASLVVIAGVLGAAVGASLVRPGPYRPAVPMEGGS